MITAELDFEAIYFSIVAGVLFGAYVAGTAPASEWRPILGWGAMIYLTFLAMANIDRFVTGHPNPWEALLQSSIRWWAFIFTTILTAGIIRYVYWRSRGRV
jgi:hypothetical protein